MQAAVVDLVGVLQSYAEIAALLATSENAVRELARRAARKMPGDLPTYARCCAWARGASYDVLVGGTHRAAVIGGSPRKRAEAVARTREAEAKLEGAYHSAPLA